MPQASATDHDALPPGTRLAEFEIECVLGIGGFGIVYRAIDHALQRRVAIKEYAYGYHLLLRDLQGPRVWTDLLSWIAGVVPPEETPPAA